MRRLVCVLLLTAVVHVAPADAHTLTYQRAMAAAQLRADAFARQRTLITVRLRESIHAYYVQVEWVTIDPIGCKGCGYDPRTETTFDTPGPEIHEVALRALCARTRSNPRSRQPCTARAYVFKIFS